jgi:hypothetical protein
LITQNNTSRVEGCCLANNSDMEIHHHPLLLFLLALMATCSLAACTDQSLNRTDFPASFIFGPRSSAYQVYIYIYVTALTFVCIQYIYVSLYIYIYIYIYILYLGFLFLLKYEGAVHQDGKGPLYGILSRGYIQVSLYDYFLRHRNFLNACRH